MNVLVVAPHYPPMRIGGVEAYTQAVVDGLHTRGHAVNVVAVEQIADGSACAAVIDERGGVAVHRLTLGVGGGHRLDLMWEHAAAEAWLIAHMHATTPQALHLHSGYLLGGPAMSAARRCRIPYVVTLHDYWFSCPRITRLDAAGHICSGPEGVGKCTWCLVADSRRVRWPDVALFGAPGVLVRGAVDAGVPVAGATAAAVAARQRALAEGLLAAAAIIAPTQFVANAVESIGVPARRVVVSPHGLPPMQVKPRVAGDGFRIRYIGQVVPHKGVHLLVDAVRAMGADDVSLTVHGPLTPRPDYVANLRARAGNDRRIVFAGPYTREELPEILAGTDLLVVPSIWHEVAGIVIMEAHAAGVPVLASRLGGIPEVLRDEIDGVLFDPFTDGDLARALARLLGDPSLMARLRAGTRPPRTNDDDVDALVTLLHGVVGRS
ncbi:MAG: glycosyltransferase [Vicinamibacterales bacterium]